MRVFGRVDVLYVYIISQMSWDTNDIRSDPVPMLWYIYVLYRGILERGELTYITVFCSPSD